MSTISQWHCKCLTQPCSSSARRFPRLQELHRARLRVFLRVLAVVTHRGHTRFRLRHRTQSRPPRRRRRRRPLLRQGEGQVDVELPDEEVVHGGAVAQVDPVADGGVLLLGLALAVDDVVVALGARHGRGQPDLLVGGLLVDDVGADAGEGHVEDAGL